MQQANGLYSVRNEGNFITRLCFADTDQMKALQRITGKAMSMCYHMTEEVGEFGYGRKSHLYVVTEEVRELYIIGQERNWETNYALMMAKYPLQFLEQLMRPALAAADADSKLRESIHQAATANCILKGRKLTELSLAELDELRRPAVKAETGMTEFVMMINGQINALESRATGSPLQSERVVNFR